MSDRSTPVIGRRGDVHACIDFVDSDRPGRDDLCHGRAPVDPEDATSATNEVVAGENVAGVDEVLIPAGIIHSSCVFEVADDESVDDDGSIRSPRGRRAVAPCQHALRPIHVSASPAGAVHAPTDNGWTESALASVSYPVNYFFAQFHVPAAPWPLSQG